MAIAMAIITLWRIPPESSCGYRRARRAASGIPTRSSNPAARRRASDRRTGRWVRIISAIWSPTPLYRLSAVSGSWKIMAISAP